MVYAGSEIILGIARRSSATDRSRDRHSLAILWTMIGLGVFGSICAANNYRFAALPFRFLDVIGLVLFVAGIALRWSAIIYLGRFFTVDVSISAEHKVIDSGPYRLIRHPSYSGGLLAFIGFGLCLRNWIAFLVLMVPITAGFLWRIHVEEDALKQALGEEYRRYAAHTKRLVPFVY